MRRIHLPRDDQGEPIDPFDDLDVELYPPQAVTDDARREALIAEAAAILS